MGKEIKKSTTAGLSSVKSLTLLKRLLYPCSLQLLTVLALLGFFILAARENSFSAINTGMLLFWSLWWPLIPFVVLFLGRFWCSICPFSTLANISKKLLPYRLFRSEWFYQYGFISSLFVYLLIVVANVTFTIESNNTFSIIFIGSMIGLMLVMIFLFGYKSYCYAACPMGLFFQLYGRFSFTRMENRKKICNTCQRRSWIPEQQLFSPPAGPSQSEQRDWRFRIECLKKCRKHSTEMHFGNPFRRQQETSASSLLETLGPGVVITIFAVSLFEKSNFFIKYYEQFNRVLPVSLPVFHIVSIPLVILFILLLNILFINLFCKISRIEQRLVYKKLAGLVLLLIMFHLSLVLQEFTELSGLVYEYQFLGTLQAWFLAVVPTIELQFCLPCVLTILGITAASLYAFFVGNRSTEGTFSHRQFWLSTLLVSVIIAEYSYYAISTLKILPYAAC